MERLKRALAEASARAAQDAETTERLRGQVSEASSQEDGLVRGRRVGEPLPQAPALSSSAEYSSLSRPHKWAPCLAPPHLTPFIPATPFP